MEITHINYESGETVPRYCLYKQTSDTLIARAVNGTSRNVTELGDFPNGGFSLLKVPASAFTTKKNHLRHCAKVPLTALLIAVLVLTLSS